jgi:hypothetical protein
MPGSSRHVATHLAPIRGEVCPLKPSPTDTTDRKEHDEIGRSERGEPRCQAMAAHNARRTYAVSRKPGNPEAVKGIDTCGYNRQALERRHTMTHEKLVSIANEIFGHLKDRQELWQMDEPTRAARPHPENDDAELQDFGKDIQSVAWMEKMGVGKLDCFAIAHVLLRAIDRQWTCE